VLTVFSFRFSVSWVKTALSGHLRLLIVAKSNLIHPHRKAMLQNEAQSNQNPLKSPFKKGGLEASASISGAESFIPPFSKGGSGGILTGAISLPF
jgi:hypothetical protein